MPDLLVFSTMDLRLPAPCILQLWTGTLLCVLVLSAHVNPQHSNASCTQHYDKKNHCCNECQAGFYVTIPCTKEKPVTCQPCGEGEYLDHSNSQTECLKQIECDNMKGFEILHEGDSMTATQCTCKANFHCSQDCEYCLRDNSCFPGFEVEVKANRISDTKCRPCPPMHFSNEISLTLRCKPRTNCTALGMVEKAPGNATSDAMCIRASTPPSPGYSILAITVGLAFGCGIIILFIYTLRSQRKYLTTLTDCVQQRFVDAWCSIRGKQRNERHPPADQANSRLPIDNHHWNPESELFVLPKTPMKATDHLSGSVFYAFSEHPVCNTALKSCYEVESLCNATHFSRIPRENPDGKCYAGNQGEGCSAAHLEDPSTGSVKPLLPSGHTVEEPTHLNLSTQESRHSVSAVPCRDCQAESSDNPWTLGSSTPLHSRESTKGHTMKCDCQTSRQSNSCRYSQSSDNTNGDSSNNTDPDHPNLSDENSQKSANSTPSGFCCGGNATYNTSGQSMLSVGGSVVFNVIVKVNHMAEQNSKGDMNTGADFPARQETHKDNGTFPTTEATPGNSCELGANAGLPVQEENFEESVCVPIQEEQNSKHGHEVHIPVQEENSRENLEGSLDLASGTVRQENWVHPKESTFIPEQ
ncbi:uncharacterized protein LOC122564549 [Chiloscyllium plagiosum]|uniref:uncharacterized protein LOC122564549 n=1 Tax=Chiloscyllium plagiosum TaxID=36176 RepID=UPI001CB827C1|nr:uncharacterized protein LOC122564549 [Chiloscyllium plagiosum]